MALQTSRKRVKKGRNLAFIAQYLYDNPGSRYNEVLRALCAHNNKPYGPGQYSQYFSSCWTIPRDYRYPGRYWAKHSGGWWLTTQGYGLVEAP